jgi:uncharacterized protein (DUF2132 family)
MALYPPLLGLIIMNDDGNYQNNPLHGVGLKAMLVELVDHYGFEILFAYLNINCFNNNPSIASSDKFLKKTVWAREKVEAFYLYQLKSLPRASDSQFELPPRDRTMPITEKPGAPTELSLEAAEELREYKEKKAATHDRDGRSPRARSNSGSHSNRSSNYSKAPAAPAADVDPWANWKK